VCGRCKVLYVALCGSYMRAVWSDTDSSSVFLSFSLPPSLSAFHPLPRIARAPSLKRRLHLRGVNHAKSTRYTRMYHIVDLFMYHIYSPFIHLHCHIYL
jgi:hypothetical protein